MQHPHIRIAMGTLNGASFLQAQLDSFLRQTHENWSLWVSDDGSDDETRQILDEFGKVNPGRLAKVVQGPGEGNVAVNFLSLLQHPELGPGPLAFSDQDDVWHPEKLRRALLSLDHGVGAGPEVWAARYTITDSALQQKKPGPFWPRGASFENALVQNILSGHTLTLNSAALDVVRKAGNPAGVVYHDWWVYQLMTGVGARICIEEQPMLFYRQHNENALGTRRNLDFLRRRVSLLDAVRLHWQALLECSDLLSDDAVRCVKDLDELPVAGLARLFGFSKVGLHRQKNTETWMLGLAALFGRV